MSMSFAKTIDAAVTGGGSLGMGALNPSVSVELDTFPNYASDGNGGTDPDGNHVGIDLNGGINSIALGSPGGVLFDGANWNAWVEFEPSTRRLSVWTAPSATRPATPAVSAVLPQATVDAMAASPNFLGFAAAQGDTYQIAELLSVKLETARTLGGYVALGDSYSSGEGVGSYLAGTDQRSPVVNLCHRSAFAYSQVVAPLDIRGNPLFAPADRFFFACSGAVTQNVRDKRQYESEGPLSDSGQISHPELGAASAVTMTIGGNDTGFTDILTHCLWRENCVGSHFRVHGTQIFGSIRKGTLRKINGEVATKLRDTYVEINAVSSSSAKIALNYPQLFPGYPQGFDCRKFGNYAGAGGPNVFIDEEQKFFREATSELSAVIEREATAAGWRFVDVIPYFAGHEICGSAGDDWLSGFKGPPGFSLKPENGSFHPNGSGQLGYARKLEPVLESITNAPASAARAAAAASAVAAATDPVSLVLEPNERDLAWGAPLSVQPLTAVPAICDGIFEANQDVVVRGQGYQPGAVVGVSFDSSATDENNLAVVTADSTGSFVATVTLPPGITEQFGQGLDAVGLDPSGNVLVSSADLIVQNPGGVCTTTTALPAGWTAKADVRTAPGTPAPASNQGGQLKLELQVQDTLSVTGSVAYKIVPNGVQFESSTLTARRLGQTIFVTGTGRLSGEGSTVNFIVVMSSTGPGSGGDRARIRIRRPVDGTVLIDQIAGQPLSTSPPVVSGGRITIREP